MIGYWFLLSFGQLRAQTAINWQDFEPSRNPYSILFFGGVQLDFAPEMQLFQYANYPRSPSEYYGTLTMGFAVPFLRSGADVGLAAHTAIQYGRSLLVENNRVLGLPTHLILRYGRMNQPDNDQRMGLGLGIGGAFHQVNGTEDTVVERDLRPSFLAEANTRFLGRPLYIRYTRTFATGPVQRHCFQLGLMFQLTS